MRIDEEKKRRKALAFCCPYGPDAFNKIQTLGLEDEKLKLSFSKQYPPYPKFLKYPIFEQKLQLHHILKKLLLLYRPKEYLDSPAYPLAWGSLCSFIGRKARSTAQRQIPIGRLRRSPT